MHYDACLFDMDGVVIDTHQAVTAFWTGFAAARGVALTPEDFSRHIYGVPGAQTLGVLFPDLTPGERAAALDHMQAVETAQTYVPVTGVLAFLRALRERGIPAALVTSGDAWKIREVGAQLGLDGLFAATVTHEDVARGKPAPECYRLAAERLGVAPERCIAFEDSLSGVAAAVASGALTVGVSPAGGAALLERGACHVIRDFSAGSVRLLEPGAAALHSGRVLALRRGCGLALLPS